MQLASFFAVNHLTGAFLPSPTVTVYVAGTSTLAALFTQASAALANPFVATATGQVQFRAADGKYDISIQSGGYAVPLIQELRLQDGGPYKTPRAFAPGTWGPGPPADVVADSGKAYVFNGASAVTLSTFNPADGNWSAPWGGGPVLAVDVVDSTVAGRAVMTSTWWSPNEASDLSRPVDLGSDDWVFPPGGVGGGSTAAGGTGFTQNELNAMNAEAAGYSAKVKATPRPGLMNLASLLFALIEAIGQSHVGSASSAIPATTRQRFLSNTALGGAFVLMMGGSVRPADYTSAVFQPVGGVMALVPLTGTDDNNGTKPTYADYQAWKAGGWVFPAGSITSSMKGEAQLVGFIQELKALCDRTPGIDTAPQIVGFDAAVTDSLYVDLAKVTATVALASIVSDGTKAVFTLSGGALAPADGTLIFLSSTGTLPAPFVTSTGNGSPQPTGTNNFWYYTVNGAGPTFNAALTPGGAAINSTTSGSGTHTANFGGSGKSNNYLRSIDAAKQFAYLVGAVVTLSNASPAILSNPGYATGDRIRLSTSGTLPTGAAIKTTYQVGTNGFAAGPGGTCQIIPISGGATVTMSDSTSAVTHNAHGKSNGDSVIFASTGRLFFPLCIGREYFVSSATTNNYRVSETPGGAALTFSSLQSGVHSVTYSLATTGAGSGTHKASRIKDVGMPVIQCSHGEANNLPTYGNAYGSNIAQWVKDYHSDINVDLLGHDPDKLPLVVMSIPGKHWSDDSFATQNAILAKSKENGNIVACGPLYPYPCFTVANGEHFTANGYRWASCKAAQIAYNVGIKGEGHQPLHAYAGTYKGTQIVLKCHVPCAPLKFGTPFNGPNTVFDDPAKGFAAYDGLGLPIASVQLMSNLVILNCSRPPQANTFVSIGGNSVFGGYACVIDSDPHVPSLVVIYDEFTNSNEQGGSALLPGVPYPMNNWIVGNSLTATAAA